MQILLAITALALSVSPGSRGDGDCALDDFWNNPGTGDWFDPLNWIDIYGNHFVPVCHYPAYITNGGTAQINSSTETAHACETFLGQFLGQSGNLTVDHGSLETCNLLHVGYGGKGTLKIMNGGSVTTYFIADIAAQTGSRGLASVDGTNSQWAITGGPGELRVGGIVNGSGGTGLLSVTNNAQVTAGSVHLYKSGTLTGNGRVNATNGTTVEGTIAPSGGTLTINGDLTFSGNVATMECSVVPTAADKVDVSGAALVTGRVSVTMTGTFTAGTTYTLLHADGLRNGTFPIVSIKYPTGGGQCFTAIITYDAHNVYLYLEPCSN